MEVKKKMGRFIIASVLLAGLLSAGLAANSNIRLNSDGGSGFLQPALKVATTATQEAYLASVVQQWNDVTLMLGNK
jgi:hypothetical protein